MVDRVNFTDLESIDLQHRSIFLTKVFSLRTALEAVRICKEKGLKKEEIPQDIAKIIENGMKNGLSIIVELITDLEDIHKNENISPYKYIVLKNIFKILDNYWLDDLHSIIINKEKMDDDDKARIRGAIREMKRKKRFLMDLTELRFNVPEIHLDDLLKNIEGLQGELFINLTEEVNAIEQYSEHVHDDHLLIDLSS